MILTPITIKNTKKHLEKLGQIIYVSFENVHLAQRSYKYVYLR